MQEPSATQQSLDDPQDIISDQELTGFLDSLMGKVYDAVSVQKPQGLTPAITMYRRANYDEPFDVRACQLMPVPLDKQMALFEEVGRSAANIKDGRIPVAIFMISMGVKTPTEEITEETIQQATHEVIIIAGCTIDGRIAQSIYDLERDAESHIHKISLATYVPARPIVTDKSTLRNGLLEAFYQGHNAQYEENAVAQRQAEGGTRHGGFILPE